MNRAGNASDSQEYSLVVNQLGKPLGGKNRTEECETDGDYKVYESRIEAQFFLPDYPSGSSVASERKLAYHASGVLSRHNIRPPKFKDIKPNQNTRYLVRGHGTGLICGFISEIDEANGVIIMTKANRVRRWFGDSDLRVIAKQGIPHSAEVATEISCELPEITLFIHDILGIVPVADGVTFTETSENS